MNTKQVMPPPNQDLRSPTAPKGHAYAHRLRPRRKAPAALPGHLLDLNGSDAPDDGSDKSVI